MENNDIYFISINTVPKDASYIDIINFASYVQKRNQTALDNLLNTKRIKANHVESNIVLQTQVTKLSFREQLEEFDKNYSDYIDF